jgi:hypothetical protein
MLEAAIDSSDPGLSARAAKAVRISDFCSSNHPVGKVNACDLPKLSNHLT